MALFIFLFFVLAMGFVFCLEIVKKLGPPGHGFQYGSYRKALQNTPWLRAYHSGLIVYFLILVFVGIAKEIMTISSIY